MSAKGLRCPSHFAQKQDIWAGFQHVCFVPKNGSGQPKFRGGTINGEFLKFDQDLSGPELQERLSQLGSALPIVFFSRYLDIPTTVRTIKAGALDFLFKPIPSDQLLQAVGQAIARYEATHTLNAVRSRIKTLTPREREVFELVVRGQSNKQVGKVLGAAARTIKAHRHRVMEKMQVQSLAELVSLAERVGVMSGRARSDRAEEK